jgi:hypothetical protein
MAVLAIYDEGTNTAALPTVNALFHSIVSTHSFMVIIDIVDYYLGALLPSPESVCIDVSSISLPTLTKLGLLPSCVTPTANLSPSVMSYKLSLVFPNPVSCPNSVLSHFCLNMSSPKPPPPCSFFRHHTHDFLVCYSHPSELGHLLFCLSILYKLFSRYTYLDYTIYRLFPPLSFTLYDPLHVQLYTPMFSLRRDWDGEGGSG